MTEKSINEVAAVLHRERCSCVIYNRGKFTLCHERGIKDIFRLLKEAPEILYGSIVADKVIGKGAAALMVLGGVKAVYADVISRPALELLKTNSISVTFDLCVDNIINRSATGICPVEKLCMECETAVECLCMIEDFINKTSDKQ